MIKMVDINDILHNKKILTKSMLLEFLNQAQQDEYGHWYIEIPAGDYPVKEMLPSKKVYFAMLYTVCADFVEEYVCVPERDICVTSDTIKNSSHYNRHFTVNDDTFELFVVKNPQVKSESE
ncbi:MAG: hypothetical protein M0Q88_01015 [Bacilli bacterium]|nr:hypothetical protein [Bacilli bacterium]